MAWDRFPGVSECCGVILITKGKLQSLSAHYSPADPTGILVWVKHIRCYGPGTRVTTVFVQNVQSQMLSQDPVYKVICYRAEKACDQIPQSMGFLLLHKTCSTADLALLNSCCLRSLSPITPPASCTHSLPEGRLCCQLLGGISNSAKLCRKMTLLRQHKTSYQMW